MSDFSLPHSLEIEQALLGGLLYDNSLFEKVSDFLEPGHFFAPLHQRLFEAIAGFLQRNSVASPLTLAPFFKDDPALAEKDAAAYLTDLGANVMSLASLKDYGQQIKDFYLRRKLMGIADQLRNTVASPKLNENATAAIEEAEQSLFQLVNTGQEERGFERLGNAIVQAIHSSEKAFKRDSHVVGVTTGLRDLDATLGGLHPSDLVIVAARPSMGKTSLITNIAFEAAKRFEKTAGKEGAPVAFFSLEMSCEQIAMRLLAQESGIASDRIRRGAISQADFPKFVEVSQTLSKLPFYMDDTPGLTVSSLRTRARRLARQKGLGLIVIDYLQLLSGGKQSAENRVQELSAITRQLKQLAKELQVPVMAASQLSRSVEQRDDKRPMLSDLRESGSIEQDADVVMFIYRAEYYIARQKPAEDSEKMSNWQHAMEKVYNKAEIMITKQRHGPIRNIDVHFNSLLTKFSDLASRPEGDRAA